MGCNIAPLSYKIYFHCNMLSEMCNTIIEQPEVVNKKYTIITVHNIIIHIAHRLIKLAIY